jgi:hypothetical protein
MSASQLHSLVSNIETTLKATLEICQQGIATSSLPDTIQDIDSQIGWILATFEKIREGIPENQEPSSDTFSLEGILNDCLEKVASLQAALRVMIPCPDSSNSEQHKQSLELVPEEDKIAILSDGILSDLERMAENEAIEAETRENVKWLVGFISGRPGFDMWGVPDSE